MADTQTAGRGRRGRVWQSPGGKNLYLSTLVRHRLPPEVMPLLTLAAGVAIAMTCEEFVVDSRVVSIKWPNDIRIARKKVSGVLVEASMRAGVLAHAVVGIGLNVHAQTFSPELAQIATSLEESCSSSITRPTVLRSLLQHLEIQFELILSGKLHSVVDAMRSRCDTIGQTVTVEEVTGVAQEVQDDGSLTLVTASGTTHHIRSGEVLMPEQD